MARWHGDIGFATTVETRPGVYVEEITVRHYSGDLIRNTRKLQSSSQVNDDINIANEFSIVAAPYANQNLYSMRYVTFMGTKWKITSVDASQYPRLTLSVGGIYNGK